MPIHSQLGPQGLEEDHWQRLQLQKVLECSFARIESSGCSGTKLNQLIF